MRENPPPKQPYTVFVPEAFGDHRIHECCIYLDLPLKSAIHGSAILSCILWEKVDEIWQKKFLKNGDKTSLIFWPPQDFYYGWRSLCPQQQVFFDSQLSQGSPETFQPLVTKDTQKKWYPKHEWCKSKKMFHAWKNTFFVEIRYCATWNPPRMMSCSLERIPVNHHVFF